LLFIVAGLMLLSFIFPTQAVHIGDILGQTFGG